MAVDRSIPAPGPAKTTKSLGQTDLTPEKYRRLIRTVSTGKPVGADYQFPEGLTGDEVKLTYIQETITRARLDIVEEIINTDEDPLAGSEADEFGNLIITETVVPDGTPADSGYLVKTSRVTPFGNDKSLKITVLYPSDLATAQLLTLTLGQDNLIPEKYRRLVTRRETMKMVDPTSYTFPTTLSGDQSHVEMIQEAIHRARLKIVEEVIGVDLSPLTGAQTDQWGVLSILESVVNDGTAASEGITYKSSQVTPLGNGKSIKIDVIYVAFATLVQTVVDDKTNLITHSSKTIVVAGTTGGVVGNVVTEVNPVDKWRSIQIVSAIDVDNLPAPEPVNIMRPFSFPDQLIALKILPGSGTSNSSGGENGYSFSWDGELSVQVLNGYRGPCAGTRTRIYSVGVPSYVPVETVILPSTGTVIIFAGSQSQDVNGTTSKTATTVRARAVTVPNVLTAGIKQNGVLVPGLVVQGFYNLSPLGGTYDINLPASVPSGLKNGQQIIIEVNVERVRGNVYLLEIITIGAVVGSTYVTNAASFIAPPR